MKRISHIFIFLITLCLFSCNGSRKYFKAAEKLEKQGLVNEAAEYYLEALQRKPTSVDARIKLKEVGQKHVSTMSSDFFRSYNSGQTESALNAYERLKDFTTRCSVLNVNLDYPREYENDYQKAVESYCLKNYSTAYLLVNRKKYYEALPFIKNVEKYNTSYKNIRQIDIIATCEPLYQSAINNLETKNYAAALQNLSAIKVKSDNYKDSQDLLELASAQQNKTFILFQPKPSNGEQEREIQQTLYESFVETAQRDFKGLTVLNNTPFQNSPASTDFNNTANVDLIQAIRKATGSDYFYVFDIINRKEFNSGLSKTPSKGYQETITKVNDSTTTTEYKPFDYYVVKASRSYSYDFKYKIINAYNNQVVASQTQNVKSNDAVEYNEFARKFTGNMNSLYPYNPQQLAPIARYNPKTWRSNFSARNSLKSFEELKSDVLTQTVRIFSNSSSQIR